MSDQSAPEDNAPEAAETTPEGPPEWLNPITERMEEIADQSRQMQDAIGGLYYEEPDEEEYEEEPYAVEDDGELSPEAARQIIGSEVQQHVDARFAEQNAQRAVVERDELFEALQDEIPAFQDEKYAREIVNAAAQELREAGAEHLIGTPYIVDVIERLHLISGLDEPRAEQNGQASKDVVLESGSGASVQQQDEPDWGDRIVNAANRLRPTI